MITAGEIDWFRQGFYDGELFLYKLALNEEPIDYDQLEAYLAGFAFICQKKVVANG